MKFVKLSLLLVAAIGLAAIGPCKGQRPPGPPGSLGPRGPPEPPGPSVTKVNLGNGDLYTLDATQDSWMESDTSKYGSHVYLIAGLHPQFPKKRFLVQFENLPSQCTTIKWAKMYLYFAYAHKASGSSVSSVPYIERDLNVHQVKKSWSEFQVTRKFRSTNTEWSEPYLALDGSDAVPYTQDTVTIFTGRPAGYVEFDVTEAMSNWKSGQSNYGLLVLATNEDENGRDLRFNSRQATDNRPIVRVLCA